MFYMILINHILYYYIYSILFIFKITLLLKKFNITHLFILKPHYMLKTHKRNIKPWGMH